MKKHVFYLLVGFSLLGLSPSLSAAAAGANYFSYEGRIYDEYGEPSTKSISLILQVMDSQKNCVLYEEETASIDLSQNSGYFSISVGQGTKLNGMSLTETFVNGKALVGKDGCPVTESAGAGRFLRVYVKDSYSTTKMEPDVSIGTSPFAIAADVANSANSVEGFNASHLLRVTDGGSAPGLTSAEADELKYLAQGSSNKYMKQASGGGASLPSFAVNPSSPAAGSIWYDSTYNAIKFSDGSQVHSLGGGGAGLTSLNGQTGSSQSFAVATNGQSFEFSSTADTHTLNIPMASATGVAAGLISKADYDSFSAKQDAGNYVTALTGDVTAAGPGSAAATITNKAVTYAKIQDVSGEGKILGRSTTGAGSVEEITLGSGLSLSGGVLTATGGGGGGSGTVTQIVAGTGLTGGTIIGSGTIAIANDGVGTAQLANGSVTDAKLENSGVAAGTYGSTMAIPVIQVDTKGRIISASSAPTGFPNPGPSGQFLKSSGSTWFSSNIVFSDIRNSIGNPAFNVGSCAANQTLDWSSLTDSFTCQNISNLDASAITAGTLNPARLPSSIIDGAWTESGGSVFRASGNVGIGLTNPADKLHVVGSAKVEGVLKVKDFIQLDAAVSPPSGCDSTEKGRIRYNQGKNDVEFCNGVVWKVPGTITQEDCPAGWVLVGSPGQRSTFCIQTNTQATSNSTKGYFEAKNDCRGMSSPTAGQAHLCTHDEWYRACTASVISSTTNSNDREWMADATKDSASIYAYGSDCKDVGDISKSTPLRYRCCLN